MKFIFAKIKYFVTGIFAAALIFGLAWLVLAYFLGYYDISFIDREAIFGSNTAETSVSETVPPPPESDEPDESSPPVTQNPETETREPDESEAPPAEVETDAVDSILAVHNTALLPDVPATLPVVSSMEGYAATDADFDPSCMTIGRMRFSFKLPAEFSRSQMETEELSYVVRQEYGEYEAEYTTEMTDRPAISLYMGYILIDNETSLFLIDGDGTPLCSFDGDVYRPAYTRDREDRPLFYKEDALGRKLYYYLSDDGKTFIGSDYDDDADSRGLYFDYPASFGKSDNDVSRVYDEATDTYGYEMEYYVITDPYFTDAFEFSEGYAWVTTSENRGGMYFISEYGYRAQYTFVSFLSDLNRYSVWDYRLPASRGIESLGFFYFDHGLARVRYQIIDYYNWYTHGSARVVSDEDRLIRTDGTFFELPAGYTLKGYSDGMILLEKDGLYGFMDYTGGWIAEPVYASATPFVSGLAVLETADGRFGMIDTEGNIVLPFAYDHLTLPSSGLIAAYREESGWTVFQVMAPVTADE